MPRLSSNKGFSTLQSVSALLIFAGTTGVALQQMPEVMDSADQAAARYAASAETLHNEVWQEYAKAMGERLPEAQRIPEPIRHNLIVTHDEVVSPLGGYCFRKDQPELGLKACSEGSAAAALQLAAE